LLEFNKTEHYICLLLLSILTTSSFKFKIDVAKDGKLGQEGTVGQHTIQMS